MWIKTEEQQIQAIGTQNQSGTMCKKNKQINKINDIKNKTKNYRENCFSYKKNEL